MVNGAEFEVRIWSANETITCVLSQDWMNHYIAQVNSTSNQLAEGVEFEVRIWRANETITCVLTQDWMNH
ncbi:hypothetical protein CIPAW_15G176400 [Carya illinoinensis]|uniref:Uncharacterized protein n=1 Tax=Carya illinoinensis TaxID=32201 RepID=A0A8T1NEL3_CARIL|nr:hypothetical protein CIPAW_15G176400 [Carya illinoinensis]